MTMKNVVDRREMGKLKNAATDYENFLLNEN